ncbi:DUF4870 domain-containing protein [Microbacterium gorillae]|uniref:DUF4870 domain-containing protein n=1 Tax=Microbacterium gorillae TaxID=1231063 RepID=UPI00058BAA18|nr:DUF4870 domain-containing protein [Microbacterium gorillae]
MSDQNERYGFGAPDGGQPSNVPGQQGEAPVSGDPHATPNDPGLIPPAPPAGAFSYPDADPTVPPTPSGTTPTFADPYAPAAPSDPYGAPAYGTPVPSDPYGAPAYNAPAYNAPAYGAPAYGTPAYGYPAPAPSGAKYWSLLFLTYIPYVGVIVAVIVALVQRGAARATGIPLAIGNANAAANFILSYLIYQACVVVCMVLVGSLTTDSSGDPSPLFVLPVLLFFAVGVWGLVMMIMGTVQGSRRVFRAVPSIPFFRD